MAPRIIHRSVYEGLAAPAVLGCLFALTPFSAALAAASGWTDTADRAPPLAGATALGAAPPSQHLHVALTLKLRNEAQMDAFITSIGTPGNPAFGTKLTPAQVKASYMPTDAQVQTVVSYLTSAGFTNIKVASNNLMINADCTVAIAEAAFNTPIEQYTYNGETVYANTQTVELPSSLDGVVTSVHGLQNALRFRPFHNKDTRLPGPVGMSADGRLSQRDAITTAAAATATTQTILPQDFAVTYDVENVPPASSTYGAIYMSGNLSNIEADLRLAEMEANLPQVPVIIKVTDGPLSSTASSGSDEFDLDSQSSQGAATNFKAEIWYDAADGSLSGALNQWVTDDLAPTMSASIGFCEAVAATPAGGEVFGLDMTATDAVLKTAVAQGKTFFASTGDNGSYCAAAANGTQAGVPAVNYPASSQYAVAVGGTTVSTYPDFTYGGESGWADSGGGISNFEPSPSWQTGVIPAATLPNPMGGRALPDISLDGDPGSGAYVIIGGAPEAVGGTSLSAPLAMGFWARMEGATGGSLGYAAPLLYGLYSKGANASYATAITGLHDVTTGSNGLYNAGAGYDYVTGMGTFDVCVLTGLLGGGATNYCTTPATPVVNTVYPDTTTAATCTLPGINLNITPAAPVLSNPAPVSPPLPIPALTLTSLSVAEPSSAPGKIVFTIGVSSLANLPPHFAWQAWFNTPAGQQYYMQMDTYSVTPEYFYGQAAITSAAGMDLVTYNNIGALDASSTYSATDNTITLVAPESDFGALAPGQELTYIYSDIMESADYPGTVDTTSVSLYQLRSSNLCTVSATPPPATTPPVVTTNPTGTSGSGSSGEARLGGGAMGGGALLPLALSVFFRRRRQSR